MATNTHSIDLERGSSQYANITDTASLSITGNLSFGCWAKFESVPGSGERYMFMSKDGDSGTNRSYYLAQFNEAGTQKLEFMVSALGILATTARVSWTPSTATWYYIFVTYTAAGGTADFYVDGAQQGTQQSGLDTSIADTNAPFSIGAFRADVAADNFFDGKINDAIIYNAAIAGATVASNFATPCSTSTTSAVSRWFLTETANDQIGSNNLTLVGSPAYAADAAYSCSVGPSTIASLNGVTAATIASRNGVTWSTIDSINSAT